MIPGFTGSPLDRADHLRADEAALARALADPRARLLRMDGLDPVPAEDGGLAWTGLGEAPSGLPLALLGLVDGVAHAVALTDSGAATQRSPLLFHLLEAWPPAEAATYAVARSLIGWHGTHRFCARCGSDTAPFRAGWARRCLSCAAEHFPRTDPVVIMLAEHGGRVLVARGPGWPPGRYSALAGFVEVGESVEDAVIREVREEAGLRLRNVRYVASQPWPFPSQLMIACIADADDDALSLDATELEAAMWVGREEVCAALAGDATAPFLAPPPYAIANTLLRRWMEDAA